MNMTKTVKTPALNQPDKESITKTNSKHFIVTDQETGREMSIEAQNEMEAVRIFRNQPVKNKTRVDLNGDGKFDEQDASLAGQALNKSKSIKQ